jgi:hypothetical protein
MSVYHEQRLTLSQAAQRMDLSVSTLWRWCQRGVQGTRLESIVIGHLRYTSVEALERFASRCTERADGVSPPTPRQRARRVAAAERELAARS